MPQRIRVSSLAIHLALFLLAVQIMAQRRVAALSSTALADRLQGQMILAPLTRGGNYPFRRLCQDFGMNVSMSEMVFARSLIRGGSIDQARLRRTPSKDTTTTTFGVQIATNCVDEGVAAMKLAQEAGADFVDLNCGCPIHEAVRRGLGSALLRQPDKLGSLVRGMVDQGPPDLPLTVKIRLGCDTPNALEAVRAVRGAGAAAVTVHGRTAEQRYRRPADWDWIRRIAEDEGARGVPVIGNGDILTYYEANRRLQETGVDAVMVGRGALIKPWIFQEFRDGREWQPYVSDRIAVYRRLACYMKEYFGDDGPGRKRTWGFLPWHFDFFVRYQSLPEAEFGAVSQERPLIHDRVKQPDDAPPLEVLMSSRHSDAHELIAAVLWDSDSDADAVTKLATLAESQEFHEIQSRIETSSPEAGELSNIPKKMDRKKRTPKPKRTPEEIALIRAERAAKRAATGLTDDVHVDGVRR